MAANSAKHDAINSPEDKAHSASQDIPNQKLSLSQKINKNSLMNLTWAEQLEELENDGVEVNRVDKVIISGPERSEVTSEVGRKDRRLIIPRNPSDFPGFPTDMGKFETAAAFGEAVLKFWAFWRKQKSKKHLHAKKEAERSSKEAERASKEAEKQRTASQNKKVVGARNENENRRNHSNRRYGRQNDRREHRDRRDHSRVDQSDRSRPRDRAIPTKEELISKLFVPAGKDSEACEIRKKIEDLPVDLLSDPDLVYDCRNESQKIGGSMRFWKLFFEDDYGVNLFKQKQTKEEKEAKSAMKRCQQEQPAPVRQQARQSEPQQFKRQKRDRVPDEIRQYAVYVEKFESGTKVKMIGAEYDSVKFEVWNAWWLESQDNKEKLQDTFELRLFNSERGEATFFSSSKVGQDFIIHAINEKAKLPGIKARGPRIESKPNLNLEFPDTLNKASPEVVIKKALWSCAKVDCEPIVCAVKPNPRSRGKTISIELPTDKLAKLLAWAVDKNTDYVTSYSERLRFWTVNKSTAEFSSKPKASAISSSATSTGPSSDMSMDLDPEVTFIDEVKHATHPSVERVAVATSTTAATTAMAAMSARSAMEDATAKAARAAKATVSLLVPLWQTHHEIPLDWERKLEVAVLSPKLSNAAKTTGRLPENCPEYGNCPRGPKCNYWHIGLTPTKKAAASSRTPQISYAPMTPTIAKTPVRPSAAVPTIRINDGDDEMEDAEIVALLQSPAIKMMEVINKVDPTTSKVEVTNYKNELKLADEGGSSIEDSPSSDLVKKLALAEPAMAAAAAMLATSSASSGTVSAAATSTGEPSDKGGLAVNRARRFCTLNPTTIPLRSRSLSTTSKKRPVRGSDGAESSNDDSLKPLVASKQKPKCQKKVSDFFPKN